MSSIFHIVSFRVPSDTLQSLTDAFLQLQDTVQRDGRKLVKSVRGGKQISPEGLHHGMDVVFVMEFENQEDLNYYLDEDASHSDFKAKVRGEWKVAGVVALDFADGQY